MQVREYDINSIKPFPDNPRRIENGIEKVAESIRQFGFRNPIILDKDGYIIAGHVRYEAAKQLGFKSLPGICADDLTEKQIELFRIVDNKTGEIAGWDYLELEKELQEIRDIDMSAFGFEEMETELKDLWTETKEEEEKEQKEKEIRCPCCGEWFRL